MSSIYLMLLWHMHQPFYKDLAEGRYAMPWARLHALKDYYGMVAILRDFPSLRMTFNLVPSLVAQIQDYANQTASEEAYEVAFRPVEELSDEDRRFLLECAFQLNHENLLSRYPRFRELFDKSRTTDSATAARLLSPQDLLDLQVLSQLAWFDEIYLSSDTQIRNLVARERDFNEEDKIELRFKEVELCRKVLDEYKSASDRGQIEISTSPFYHPILPLLCDTQVAREAHPGVRLPSHHFQHPEDARDQLRAAIQLHQKVFGRRPSGLWPSEGSVSDEVLRLAADEGFTWTATDEGVLGRSRQMGFSRRSDGTIEGGSELYRPHVFSSEGRAISIYFRDHQLSDLVGFIYSHMDPRAAAEDLHQRIKAAGRSVSGQPAVVPIILDGENAWEYYPGNGREFLKEFYGRLAADPALQTVTASEALKVTEPGQLYHVHAGSWINANFDVWIGADEDNRAWDLLAEARDFYIQNNGRTSQENAALAQQELWVAEGSDWCWWYGPEHSTANDEEFDLLYRKHLSNIYRLLGGFPPDELAEPIKRPRTTALSVPPTGLIQPRIDGLVSNYFEWLGAGLYLPDTRSGSMHASARAWEALYYGFSQDSLFLRLDPSEAFLKEHPEFEVRVNVVDSSRLRLHASIGRAGLGAMHVWRDDAPLPAPPASGGQLQVAFQSIFELRLDYRLLGSEQHQQIRVQVSIWANALPLHVIPQEGWLSLRLTDELISW
jgi:alpha-amylase/alpha-mannosidase (GH57 family)